MTKFTCSRCENEFLADQGDGEYCDDCLQDMGEAAFERSREGEPPKSMDELHREAWEQKQKLHRR